jgi:hypothetical protein
MEAIKEPVACQSVTLPEQTIVAKKKEPKPQPKTSHLKTQSYSSKDSKSAGSKSATTQATTQTTTISIVQPVTEKYFLVKPPPKKTKVKAVLKESTVVPTFSKITIMGLAGMNSVAKHSYACDTAQLTCTISQKKQFEPDFGGMLIFKPSYHHNLGFVGTFSNSFYLSYGFSF